MRLAAEPVNIAPLEADEFAGPHPCPECELHQVPPLTIEGAQDRPLLFRREWVHVVDLDLSLPCVRPAGEGVAVDQLLFHRIAEGRA